MHVFGTWTNALNFVIVNIVGIDYCKILNEVSDLIDNKISYDKMSHAVNPYGDGKACGRIVKTLE